MDFSIDFLLIFGPFWEPKWSKMEPKASQKGAEVEPERARVPKWSPGAKVWIFNGFWSHFGSHLGSIFGSKSIKNDVKKTSSKRMSKIPNLSSFWDPKMMENELKN